VNVAAQRIVIFLAIVLFVGSTAWGAYARIAAQQQTRESDEHIVAALKHYCQVRQKFSEQYKIRGENEKRLARTLLLETIVAIQSIKDNPPSDARDALLSRFQRSTVELNHIIQAIHIIPLVNCAQLAKDLADTLPPG
jgi:hypothetical protein